MNFLELSLLITWKCDNDIIIWVCILAFSTNFFFQIHLNPYKSYLLVNLYDWVTCSHVIWISIFKSLDQYETKEMSSKSMKDRTLKCSKNMKPYNVIKK